jgi:uncharacterized protein (DUF2252 family)
MPAGPDSGSISSATERAARGKARRRQAPRSSHAAWEPASEREDPVEVLGAQDETRVPELIPVRYGRMLTSQFSFYRGAAAIMAADLATTPNSGLEAQLCGDAHVSNFGAFEAPDRRLVFDINDFDETLPGPFEWDVKRLAASLAVGGRERGFRRRERRAIVLAGVGAYRKAMRRFAATRDIEVWYSRLDVVQIFERYRQNVTRRDVERFDKAIAKARHKDSLRALAKLTERRNGELRFASRPPLLIPVRELADDRGLDEDEVIDRIRRLVSEYRATLDDHNRRLAERYRFFDAAHKVVGVGSVGARAWVALLFGRDADDPLFLQVKEAQASVLEPSAGRSRFRHCGRRVVAGQRLMQAAGDVLLGWLTAEGPDGVRRHFYVRQLWDGKGSPEVDAMNPTTMGIYAELCGWSLARAHARSGDRVAIAAYLGKGNAFDSALGEFAEAYADQNERDYRALLDAVDAGCVTAVSGV